MQRRHIRRLHLFPDTEMPVFVKENLGSQQEQVQPVPRRSDEYTPEERAKLPILLCFSGCCCIGSSRRVGAQYSESRLLYLNGDPTGFLANGRCDWKGAQVRFIEKFCC
ncbi:unnamed protein product [Heligmosomoides polygyrus]|uniref:Uncharacterized protein n=1 Tax=Heligmosomoides polygyrus TaxID=6339 RepID=A0A183FV50_HELPZ|nr:unnamed protein product [Heligmosomoides polygyrus]